MSKLAEILGVKEGQVFMVEGDDKQQRIYCGRRQHKTSAGVWTSSWSELELTDIINRDRKITFVTPYTNEQRKECEWIREMFPEAKAIRVSTTCVGNRRLCNVYDDDNAVIVYLSDAFYNAEAGNEFLIDDVLLEDESARNLLKKDDISHGWWKPVMESEMFGTDPIIDPVGAYLCSVCGREAICNCNDEFVLSKFCPRCGARMYEEGFE